MRDAAVVILAAGAGTRMKSATPKVLHTLAGRSMLAHSLHAVAEVAPHAPRRGGRHGPRARGTCGLEIGRDLGRPVEIAVQDEQRGTGHAVECGLPPCPRTSPVSSSSSRETSHCWTPRRWPT